jgi:hypothetical protein
MVNTGVPLMLHEKTGPVFGSEFDDVYDRINLHVYCTHRDPDGASQYRVYGARANFDIPVATFEFGAGGTLGNITFDSGGSLRTQAIDAFLVEVGGYVDANANAPCPPSLFLHTSTHAMFLLTHRPRHRRFTASDGHKYSWSWRTSDDRELEWSVSIFTNV